MIIFVPIGSSSAVTTPGTPGVDMTGLDVVKQAYQEIGTLNATEDPSGEDADFGLAKVNRILDRWNVERKCAFAETLTPYTLTPSLSPHTIGPSGTFTVVQRPMTLEAATLITAGIRSPITLRDRAWYVGQAQLTLTSTIPTDLYYEDSYPNGSLYLWPIPSAAAQLELMARGLLSALALTTRLSLPPGYRDALIKTLAEELVNPMRVPMPPDLPHQAKDARSIIFGANVQVPRLTTDVPGGRGRSFDYRTGL